jgi:hypothetical protein
MSKLWLDPARLSQPPGMQPQRNRHTPHGVRMKEWFHLACAVLLLIVAIGHMGGITLSLIAVTIILLFVFS